MKEMVNKTTGTRRVITNPERNLCREGVSMTYDGPSVLPIPTIELHTSTSLEKNLKIAHGKLRKFKIK